MTPTVTPAQREALYDQILDRLSGIGDIEMAIEAERYDDAERIGREYSDDLRLLLDDLGIGRGDGRPILLTTSPDMLRRILPRLRERATNHTSSLEGETSEVLEVRDRNNLVAEACEAILADLDSTPTGSR
jgi:hypothetical protein